MWPFKKKEKSKLTEKVIQRIYPSSLLNDDPDEGRLIWEYIKHEISHDSDGGITDRRIVDTPYGRVYCWYNSNDGGTDVFYNPKEKVINLAHHWGGLYDIPSLGRWCSERKRFVDWRRGFIRGVNENSFKLTQAYIEDPNKWRP